MPNFPYYIRHTDTGAYIWLRYVSHEDDAPTDTYAWFAFKGGADDNLIDLRLVWHEDGERPATVADLIA